MLWFFGIFAAIISTGGVMDVGLASIKKVKSGGSLVNQLLNSSFIGYELFAQYIRQIHLLGTERALWMIVILTLIAIALVVMAVTSQGALILGAKSKNAPKPYPLRKQALTHFWDLFILAAITKILTGVLILLMTLPLVLLFVENSQENVWIFFVLMALFLPVVIIVNIVSMFALIDIVYNNHKPLHAIEHGIHLFRRQWLASFEYGLILFFLVFCAGFGLLGLIALSSIPYAILYTISVLSGVELFFIATNVIFALGLMLIVLIFGGASVTFQYTAWYTFYKRAMHKTHGKMHFSKYFRIFWK